MKKARFGFRVSFEYVKIWGESGGKLKAVFAIVISTADYGARSDSLWTLVDFLVEELHRNIKALAFLEAGRRI